MTLPPAKISATILDFGEPLLRQLDETPPIEVMRHTLQIVITVWNAHVLAMPEWGEPGHLESLNKLVDSSKMPPELVTWIDRRLSISLRCPQEVVGRLIDDHHDELVIVRLSASRLLSLVAR